jgi:hypothetical protein
MGEEKLDDVLPDQLIESRCFERRRFGFGIYGF